MARAVPASQWQQPIAAGKWSPAEITAHLTEVYVVLRREMAGGAGMQMRGSAFRRWLLRRGRSLTILRTAERRPNDLHIECRVYIPSCYDAADMTSAPSLRHF